MLLSPRLWSPGHLEHLALPNRTDRRLRKYADDHVHLPNVTSPSSCSPGRPVELQHADDHTHAPCGLFALWRFAHNSMFQDVPNGPFPRGLPHESTVRGLRALLWVPCNIFAQWNCTLAGCLMSSLCEASDVGVPSITLAQRNGSLLVMNENSSMTVSHHC